MAALPPFTPWGRSHAESATYRMARYVESALTVWISPCRRSTSSSADERRRVLLEVDRERGNVARIQKDLETYKAAADKAAKAQADKLAQALLQIEQLRQHGTDLELAQASLRAERDQLQKLMASNDGERHTLTHLRSTGAAKASARRRAR